MKVSKRCTRCGREMLFYHFSPQIINKSDRTYNYLASICKECKCEIEEKRRRDSGVPRKSDGYDEERLKVCHQCKLEKPMREFYKRNDRNTVKSICKVCFRKNAEQRRREKGSEPYSKNMSCPGYLGVHIAEDLVERHAVNMTRMKFGNEGFDFLYKCKYRVDVKSSVRIHGNRAGSDRWQFHIDRNPVADYFLLLAFDNKDDACLEYVWVIPGSVLRNKRYATIGDSTLSKWDMYKSDFILKDL